MALVPSIIVVVVVIVIILSPGTFVVLLQR
jgi:hypothetical protein